MGFLWLWWFSFSGEPEKYQHWYYHFGVEGFGALIFGIVVSALTIYLQHVEDAENRHHNGKSNIEP